MLMQKQIFAHCKGSAGAHLLAAVLQSDWFSGYGDCVQCVLWGIVVITFLCVSIPCTFLLIQAVVWRGGQPDSLINSSRTAELELKKRDGFPEKSRNIESEQREMYSLLSSTVYFPFGLILFFTSSWIHCPIVLHQSFCASASPSRFPSFCCHVVGVHAILFPSRSHQFFICIFLWCVRAFLQVGTSIV